MQYHFTLPDEVVLIRERINRKIATETYQKYACETTAPGARSRFLLAQKTALHTHAGGLFNTGLVTTLRHRTHHTTPSCYPSLSVIKRRLQLQRYVAAIIAVNQLLQDCRIPG